MTKPLEKEIPVLDCILLVDDDEVANFVNESLIKDEGLTKRLVVAKNGREALAYIHEPKSEGEDCPRLILLDVNMPVMNGFDFLKAFHHYRGKWPSTVVLMLTSSINPRDLESAMEAGADGFLNKPLTADKLKGIFPTYFK